MSKTNAANGNARPNAIVIYQKLITPDSSFVSVYLKDRFTNKPLIQQFMSDETLTIAIVLQSHNVDATVSFNDPWLARFADWDTGGGHKLDITSAPDIYVRYFDSNQNTGCDPRRTDVSC